MLAPVKEKYFASLTSGQLYKPFYACNLTQHGDIQHNYIQYDYTQHNDIRHNNDTLDNKPNYDVQH